MALPPPGPRPLVGRSAELDQLAELLGLTTGTPAVSGVLLSGDAGVGKTTVLAALCRLARDAGWQVVEGHCLDLGDSALPYLPFSEIFGGLSLEQRDAVHAASSPGSPIDRLLPGRRLLGRDVDARRVERAALFDAVHEALAALSVRSPLLVVIEDVHWADGSTREVLSFLLARRPPRVVVVASYRSDDLHRRHPLRAAAAAWMRLPGVARLALSPLPDDDVRRLLHSLHPAPMPDRDVRDIVVRAEGNAFFAEELLAARTLGEHELPADLADVLLVRLDQLDDAARGVVRAASAAGRRVPHVLLAQVSDLAPEPLDAALRAAVDANVLVADGADGYRFRHALLAEAVYGDLLPGERVRLHGRYAAAIGSGAIPGTAAELARHARLAHDSVTAVRASLQAGDEAMAVGGPDEASRHYEAALELLAETQLSGRQPDGELPDIAELTVRAADAASAAGRVHRAEALLQGQLSALPPDAPAEQRATLLVALAATCFLMDSALDPEELTAQAEALVPAGPSRLRAVLANVRARAFAMRRRREDAARWARESRDIAQQLGLADVAAEAATTLANLERASGDPEAARRALERNAEAARASGLLGAELRTRYTLAMLQFERGELGEAAVTFERAWRRAVDASRPWSPYGIDSRNLLAILAYLTGDWDRALRLADVSDEPAPALVEAVCAAIGLSVAAGRGDERGIDILPTLRPWWEREGLVAVHAAAAAIDLHGDRGDVEAAESTFDDVVATVSRGWANPYFEAQIRLGALLLGQLAAAAPAAGRQARRNLLTRAAAVVDTARATSAAAVERSGGAPGPESAAWLARISAEHLRLLWLCGEARDLEPLATAWTEAVDAFQRFGHVFETARSQARLATVLRGLGRLGDAARQAAAARQVAQRLGARPLLRELGEPGRGHDESLLTPREQEVLALVALGRSNGEIGRQLFISTKTASVHVSNILAKLGAASRTEAVAVARRRGAIDETP